MSFAQALGRSNSPEGYVAGARVRRAWSDLASFPAEAGGGPCRAVSSNRLFHAVYEKRLCLSGRRQGDGVGGREAFVLSKIPAPFGPALVRKHKQCWDRAFPGSGSSPPLPLPRPRLSSDLQEGTATGLG